MTYQEAYDKIIQAYFNDEIKPYDSNFCFCGTLNNGKESWTHRIVCNLSYSYKEFGRMETALFSVVGLKPIQNGWFGITDKLPEFTEDLLFAGMSAALDVLKQIHIERGEVIDEVPVFTKRAHAAVS